jgi:uncharacterized membrane protein YhhN
MNKTTWRILFFTVLAADLFCIYQQAASLRLITKPLLVVVLFAYLFIQTRNTVSPYKKWILLALLFSWIGDVALLFESHDSLYFLIGLGSFLMAHIFYSIFFQIIRIKERISSKPILLLPVILYYSILLNILSPYLNEMKLPVRVYGLVISFMLLLALHLYTLAYQKAGWWMLIGAVLFISSDSVLAIHKFYAPVYGAGIIIMATYGIAQWMIVEGALIWIHNSSHAEKPEALQLK